MIKRFLLVAVTFLLLHIHTKAQSLYFPPISFTANWDTISPNSLGWCLPEIDSLYGFLEKENTKGFMVLKDGKIVLEKYFGNFTKDSVWYWASAGKTITSFLIGKAQEENFLKLTDTSSKYLGNGWTNCTLAQENKMSIRNHLTMTTGLDDGVTDNHCTDKICLTYKADAGNRWAYHNAPYTLLEKVITAAISKTINNYTSTKLSAKTGINGLWFTNDFDNVFYSKVRNMARFGLLYQNNCIWNNDTLLYDTNYINQSINSSQNINLSYGYLWWLNGKTSCMVPETQLVFPFSICPAGPPDMIAALGKNGQIINVVPSQNLVFIRMGDMPGTGDVPFTLNNEIWKRLNLVICNTSVNESNDRNEVVIYPNPTSGKINITNNVSNSTKSFFKLYTIFGEEIINIALTENNQSIDLRHLKKGIYFSKILTNEKNISTQKIIIR